MAIHCQNQCLLLVIVKMRFHSYFGSLDQKRLLAQTLDIFACVWRAVRLGMTSPLSLHLRFFLLMIGFVHLCFHLHLMQSMQSWRHCCSQPTGRKLFYRVLVLDHGYMSANLGPIWSNSCKGIIYATCAVGPGCKPKYPR